MANKPLGPANNYELGQNFYDTLKSAFEHLKHDINGKRAWNRPIEQEDGMTLSFVAKNAVRVSHIKYVVVSPYLMEKREKPHIEEFLNAFVTELAKKYKKMSGSAIKFKKVKEVQDAQFTGNLADRGWYFGSTVGGMLGKYMITTSRIYEIDTKNMPE